jgi:hypothetical protein
MTDAWQKGVDKLDKVGEQMVEQLGIPGLETNIYLNRATPDVHMLLERKYKILWIFPATEQLARIYQTWTSDDQFILDFPYWIEPEMRKKLKKAFKKIKRANPRQFFKIDD